MSSIGRIKVEFTVAPEYLGAVVLMVEEVGATDFTFVALRKKKYKTRQPKAAVPPPVTGKGAEITTNLIRKKGEATRQEIATALEKGGMSAKTMNGLVAKMKDADMITQIGRGTYKLGNGAVS